MKERRSKIVAMSAYSSGRAESVTMTEELIDGFVEELTEKGRSQESLKNYRAILMGLYEFLPEDKRLDSESTGNWRRWLKESGYSARTINSRISALNSFLQYLGRREWQSDEFHYSNEDTQPELTRAEYVRLLQAAKASGRERSYLLIKTLGGAGVRIQELPQLTVESLVRGRAQLKCHNTDRVMHIPEPLRRELLDYARREGIKEGPVFVTQEGSPLIRSSVWHYVNIVSKDARVDEEKANPRCLWKMYRSTFAGIRSGIDLLIEQAYERMMEEEQLAVGWER